MSNAATAAASFVTTVALARVLGVEEFGRVVFAQTLANIFFIVVDPRLEDALIRYLPLVEKRSGGGAAAALFRRFMILDFTLALAGALLAGALVLSTKLAGVESAKTSLLLLAVAQMAAQAPYGTVSAAYGVTGGWERFGVVDIGRSAVTTIFGLLGLHFGGASGFLAATAACTACSTVVVGLASARRITARFGPPSALDRDASRGVLRFTVTSSAGSSLAIGMEQLPLAILGVAAGPHVLAIFRVALAPARLVLALASPASAVLFTRFTVDAAEGRPREIHRRAAQWTAASAPLALAVVLGSWLLLPHLLPAVFGEAFRSAGTAASYLVGAALLRGTVVWAKVVALAVGRPGVRIAALLVESGLLAFTTVVFAKDGASAVAQAHLVIAGLHWIAWWVLLRRLTTEPWLTT